MKKAFLASLSLLVCACAPMQQQRNAVIETKTVKEHFTDGNGKETEITTCTGEIRY